MCSLIILAAQVALRRFISFWVNLDSLDLVWGGQKVRNPPRVEPRVLPVFCSMMVFIWGTEGGAIHIMFQSIFAVGWEHPNLHLAIWVCARLDVIQALRQVLKTLVATAGVAGLAMAMDLLSWSYRVDCLACVLVELANSNLLILGTMN